MQHEMERYPVPHAPTPASWEKAHDVRYFAENLSISQFRALSNGLGLGTLKPAGLRQRQKLPTVGSQNVNIYGNAGMRPLPTVSNEQVAPGAAMQQADQLAGQLLQQADWASGRPNPNLAAPGTQKAAKPRKERKWLFSRAQVSSQEGMQGRVSRNVPTQVQNQQAYQERKTAETQAPQGKAKFGRYVVAWTFDFILVMTVVAIAIAAAVMIAMIKTGETDNWLALRPMTFLAERSHFEMIAGIYAIFGVYMLFFKAVAGKTCGEVIFARQRAKTTQIVTR